MNMLHVVILACTSLAAVLPFSARSQGMPPPAHSSSPYYVPPGAQSGNGITPMPQAHWLDRSGAIAGDAAAGILAFSESASSERSSTNEALSKCKAQGGRDCRIFISYTNQCAAFVVGDNTAISYSAGTTEKAAAAGMEYCTTTKQDSNCRIYYSGCSLPVRAD